MFKDDIKTLKEYIYIKRRQVNGYHEIKASLSEKDLMLHVDFAVSYKNDQQDTIQSAQFGNQCYRIFTAYFYAKNPNNNDVRNDNIIVVTENSDHDRVASNIWMNKRTRMFMFGVMEWGHNLDLVIYSNYQPIKAPWMEWGGTVKNVIFKKVKPGQLAVHSPLEVSETVTKFIPSIHSVYLPENEKI